MTPLVQSKTAQELPSARQVLVAECLLLAPETLGLGQEDKGMKGMNLLRIIPDLVRDAAPGQGRRQPPRVVQQRVARAHAGKNRWKGPV
jgi:hypothetical protein